MRTALDRLRHAVTFEILALALVAPLGALAFGLPIHDFGVVAIVSATIATGWNYVYNLCFDRLMLWRLRTTAKTLTVRLAHALLFEAGLLAVLAPAIAWYLDIGLWEALVLDASLAIFYVGYAFAFNWGYDQIFPLRQPEIAAR